MTDRHITIRNKPEKSPVDILDEKIVSLKRF
jgi:hypothetical protein